MVFFKNKPNLPEYASHYGMHRPPFSTDIEDDMFFADPTRTQRMDILLHLTRYSNELLIVTGERGSGKTTFIEQFLKHANNTWKICRINGASDLTNEQLLQMIYKGFGISSESDQKNALLANLRKNLEELLKSRGPVVITVDDAHSLSVETLSLLLDISTINNHRAENSMRVVLFCEPQIKIRLAEPELGEKLRVKTRKIDIPSLSEQNTRLYLQHRLTMSGMEAEQFLTANTVNKIHQQSGGIPLKINEAADKILYDTTPIIRRTSNTEEGRSIRRRIQLAIAFVLVAGIASTMLYVQFRQPQDTNNALSDTDGISEQKLSFQDLLPQSLSQKTQKEIEAQKIKSAMEAQEAASQSTTVTAVTDEEIPFIVPGSPGGPIDRSLKLDGNPGFTQALTPLPQQHSQQGSPSAPITLIKSADSLNDASWLLSQNPSHFTLQLVTGHQKSTITRFIEKYKLDSKEGLAYFHSTRNGKSRHNLTYGIYTSHQSATEAMKALDRSLSEVKPWIRRLKSVQSDISESK